MHRIDVPSATVDKKFTEGSPTGGIAATTVSASWLNDLQENVCKVVEGAGLTLTKGRALDLLDAITAIAVVNSGQADTGSNDYLSLKVRDRSSGLSRNLLIQWCNGQVAAGTGSQQVLFPLAFSDNMLAYSIVTSSPGTVVTGQSATATQITINARAWTGGSLTVPAGVISFSSIFIGF